MDPIHLEFDIDREVHPELHAMLSAIASEPARAERLRQLATTGLLWERLRLAGLDMLPTLEELQREVDTVARELPVLLDIVPPEEALRLVASAIERLPPPEPPKPVTRPRLQRMKEKGLFKNG